MEIKKTGIAGTLESSDILIRIEKEESSEAKIEIKSIVENQFGKQIREVIKETLEELGIKNVLVVANDKGALDCTIKARVKTAIYRACESEDFKFI